MSALKSTNQAARPLAPPLPDNLFARFYCKNRFEYLMRKTRVTVGRTSARSAADVDVGYARAVSRNHLEVYVSDTRLYALVTGRNGVFINDVFHRKGAPPFQLSKLCMLRFPCTDIRIQFQIMCETPPTPSLPLLPPRREESRPPRPEPIDTPLMQRPLLPTQWPHPLTAALSYRSPPPPDPPLSFADQACQPQGHRGPGHLCQGQMGQDDMGQGRVNQGHMAQGHMDHSPLDSCVLRQGQSLSEQGTGSDRQAPRPPVSLQPPLAGGCLGREQGRERSVKQTVGASEGGRERKRSRPATWGGRAEEGRDAEGGLGDRGGSMGGGEKPPYSYAQLIMQALGSQRDKQLTLAGIYAYITRKYPYYHPSDKGWQNSIRHNLSLNRYFVRVARGQDESGKGSFWRVDPHIENSALDSAFKRKRRTAGLAQPGPHSTGLTAQPGPHSTRLTSQPGPHSAGLAVQPGPQTLGPAQPGPQTLGPAQPGSHSARLIEDSGRGMARVVFASGSICAADDSFASWEEAHPPGFTPRPPFTFPAPPECPLRRVSERGGANREEGVSEGWGVGGLSAMADSRAVTECMWDVGAPPAPAHTTNGTQGYEHPVPTETTSPQTASLVEKSPLISGIDTVQGPATTASGSATTDQNSDFNSVHMETAS